METQDTFYLVGNIRALSRYYIGAFQEGLKKKSRKPPVRIADGQAEIQT
jgi:hypothetical protein